jgi:hypothetical protein
MTTPLYWFCIARCNCLHQLLAFTCYIDDREQTETKKPALFKAGNGSITNEISSAISSLFRAAASLTFSK